MSTLKRLESEETFPSVQRSVLAAKENRIRQQHDKILKLKRSVEKFRNERNRYKKQLTLLQLGLSFQKQLATKSLELNRLEIPSPPPENHKEFGFKPVKMSPVREFEFPEFPDPPASIMHRRSNNAGGSDTSGTVVCPAGNKNTSCEPNSRF